jgi:hypothetical protein
MEKRESCDQTYFIASTGDELSLSDCKIERNSGSTYTSIRITAGMKQAQESQLNAKTFLGYVRVS